MSDAIQTPEVKIEAVKWDKRGNKIVTGDARKLIVDPLLNIRFRKGSDVMGVHVDADTYDLDSMKQQIIDAGRVQEAVTVSVRANGDHVVIRGNRRTLASRELLEDPQLPDAVRKALSDEFPMILLHGLTTHQEMEMINDQTQKGFMRSEVIRHIIGLRKMGWTFERIAMLLWETLGKFSGNAKKLAEVRAITDATAKREKIRTWLRGTLDEYIIGGVDLGPLVQKAMLLSEMAVDGLLPENAEKPYFITTKNSQKRMQALKKAKTADGTKWNGQVLIEGSEFKKVMDGFHAEDYGLIKKEPKPPVPKMLDKAAVEGLRDTATSRAVRAVCERILGAEVGDLGARDDFAAGQETREQLVEQYLPTLKPEVAAILRLCYINPNLTDFQNFLEMNVGEAVPEANAE